MKKHLLLLLVALANVPVFGLNNFVLISAPGSGKGTFSQYMVEKYGYKQICLGDLFRSEIKQETELGLKIKPLVEANLYVDEKLVCQLVKQKLEECKKKEQPFILDGFPRSQASLVFLLELLAEYKDIVVLQLEATDEVCKERILQRQVCTNCFQVFNLKTAPPVAENICSQCQQPLSVRSADRSTKTIDERLNFFHQNTEKLIAVINGNYAVFTIKSDVDLVSLYPIYDEMVGEKNAKV